MELILKVNLKPQKYWAKKLHTSDNYVDHYVKYMLQQISHPILY